MVELKEEKGAYSTLQGAKDHEKCLIGTKTDYMKELSYQDRKMIHNLKYFTWVEQQGKEIEDLNQLWYDRNFWPQVFNQTEVLDQLINDFNDESGVLKNLE